MGQAFQKAAATYGVPVELLVALAYAETPAMTTTACPASPGATADAPGLQPPGDDPGEGRRPHRADPEQLKTDTAANIMGGAALLAHYAAERGDAVKVRELGDWFEAVARYSQLEGTAARDYALQVFAFLNRGIDVKVDGEEIRIEPQAVEPDLGGYANLVTAQSQDYGPRPGCRPTRPTTPSPTGRAATPSATSSST